MLGVSPTVDDAALRRAYIAQARLHHPDRHGGDPARMRAVNEAWAVLRDPARRAAYDRSIVRPAEPSVPQADGPRFRPGQEPDPRYPAHDDPWLDDDGDLLGDDHDPAVRVTVALPRWLRILPVATLVGAFVVAFLGTVVASEPLFALGLMMAVLSFLFFISAPFVALLGSRTGSED